jgi:hypothetical protein
LCGVAQQDPIDRIMDIGCEHRWCLGNTPPSPVGHASSIFGMGWSFLTELINQGADRHSSVH